jgi:hypothetical protein
MSAAIVKNRILELIVKMLLRFNIGETEDLTI